MKKTSDSTTLLRLHSGKLYVWLEWRVRTFKHEKVIKSEFFQKYIPVIPKRAVPLIEYAILVWINEKHISRKTAHQNYNFTLLSIDKTSIRISVEPVNPFPRPLP